MPLHLPRVARRSIHLSACPIDYDNQLHHDRADETANPMPVLHTDQDTALLAAQTSYVLGAEADLLQSSEGGGARPDKPGMAVRKANYAIRSPSDRLLVQAGKFLDATVCDMPNRRRFLEAAGKATEMGRHLPSFETARQRVLDRMKTHVDICTDCQKAVVQFTALRDGLRVAGFLAAIAGLLAGAALLGLGAASFQQAGSSGAISFLRAVAAHKWMLLAAFAMAVACGTCAFGVRKAEDTLRLITGYVYTEQQFQKDLQKIPGTAKVPVPGGF